MGTLLTVCLGIFTTASTNLLYAQNFMALIALYHGDLVIQTWMTFVVYQAFNLITAGIVMFANFAIPALNRFSCELIVSFCSKMLIIFN